MKQPRHAAARKPKVVFRRLPHLRQRPLKEHKGLAQLKELLEKEEVHEERNA